MGRNMKPEILNISDFKFRPGSIKEAGVLLRSIELAAELLPFNNFVELGAFKGDTSKIIIKSLNILKCKSYFYSVDINIPGPRRTWRPKTEWMKTCYGLLKDTRYCYADFLESKSWDSATTFPNETVNWLLIDACHCFECVTKDTLAYIPKIAPSGLILFHDTARWDKENSQWSHDDGSMRPFGVNKAIDNCKMLQSNFKLLFELKAGHGIQVWQRR